MSHALHKLHMHVEWGIRALIVYLDSNCDNVCMLGELIGGTQAHDTSQETMYEVLWVKYGF